MKITPAEKSGVIELLCRILLTDKDYRVRLISAESLGKLRDARAISVLSQAASQDPAFQVRIGAEELALLAEMGKIAQNARHQADAKVQHLVAWIKEYMCPNLGQPQAVWNDRRLLIFTEYLDTKSYLERQLIQAIGNTSQRLGFFHGGMGEQNREQIKIAFNADPHTHPLRILIATDAAREGINLQNYCADLFHFDIPWNPSRMEQRNGRIDRKLQREAEVRCHYFILKQRAEDRVMDVLVKKTATIQRELGSLSPVLERQVAKFWIRGFIASRKPN